MTSAEEMLQSGTNFIKQNIGVVAAGAGGIVAGAALGSIATAAISKSGKRKRRKSKGNTRKGSSKAPKRKRRTRSRGRRTPRTAGKGKDTSHKRIRYTKKGQPYVIMASGKARFIKKKGARASHKRKGGRY